MPRRPHPAIPLLVVALGLSPVAAELSAQQMDRERWTALTVDNDYFHGSDYQYTSGFRFTVAEADEEPDLLPEPFMRGADRLLPEEDSVLEEGWFLAQYIFTPTDRDKLELGPTDRPYAGWLGGGVWIRETLPSVSRAVGVTAGIVGPASMAEHVQDGLHRIIGKRQYAWSEQLHNEPTLNLHLRETRRLWSADFLGVSARLDAEGGIDLGNASTALIGRTMVRAGTFEPTPFFPTERFGPGPQIAEVPENRTFGWGISLGAEGRLVGRDIFLDGNTFEDSHSVDSHLLVGSLVAGFSLHSGLWVLHYTFVYHGEDYEGQEEAHRYGSLTLARRF